MHEVAIVGAGPYGLSIAAHLRMRSVPFRIFGPPMDTWISHMPKGMCLKSDGFASDLYDPARSFTLKTFCAERGIPYKDMGLPVRLETFTSYGVAFSERMVPELEKKMVLGVQREGDGFVLQLENGETCRAKRVILAVGITHFEYVPEALAKLPAEFVSHSARQKDPATLKGRDVVVIGGGASALDLAGLLHASGANVQLIARKPELNFHSKPTGKPRSFWKRLRHPDSGLGPGMRSRFYANAPWAFRYLPEKLRLDVVKRALGPSGGYFVHDMVVGKVPLLLGYTTYRAEVQGNKVHLFLRDQQGAEKEVMAEHVIAATGYKVSIDRLKFLSEEIRVRIRTREGSPALSRRFESTVPGLYFAGLASANSFGPVMRFAFGAGFAAQRISDAVVRSISVSPAKVGASQWAVSEK
ncbi:MAG TPA: NAD(P)-binding domain-containing protein [Candidatus Sulfotelmatobacter sp.]|nr:NAD(P)-binding domain-containing protein [Candidatus Sulfotelmatobacter sp.]